MELIEKYLPINTPEKINYLINEITNRKINSANLLDLINQICLQIRKKKLQEMFRADISTYMNQLKVIEKDNFSKKILPTKKTDQKKHTNSLNSLTNNLISKQKNLIVNDKSRKKVEQSKKKTINYPKVKISGLDESNTSISQKANKQLRRKYTVNSAANILAVSPGSVIGKNYKEIAMTLNVSELIIENILKKHSISSNKTLTSKDYQIIKTELNEYKIAHSIDIRTQHSETSLIHRRYNNRFSNSFGKEGNYFKLIYIRSK